ncbi:MAG: heavy metal-associated domain-containing protein [Armatimonas sp.]
MSTSTFTAPEIECQGCANSIKKSVGNVPGVQSVEVDIATKQVSVAHDASTPMTAIATAIEKAGFTPVAS